MTDNLTDTGSKPQKARRIWMLDLVLIVVLLAGAYFRLVGWNWGEYTYLHPDERFLVWVGTDISPVKSLAEYFDTAHSSLNPVNRGHGFYVYGTLPMFITRYVVQAIYNHSGFEEMTNVGRPLSALVDVLTVLFVYLIAKKLYDRRAAILAAAFSAFTVLQIQQSHFFTMDTFITFFTTLALYFAARVAVETWEKHRGTTENETQHISRFTSPISGFISHPLFLPSLGFGIALGCAASSKINAVPVALTLPLAIILRLVSMSPEERNRHAGPAFIYLVMAAFISLLTFRIFQPYAFSGPGFFGLKPDPTFVANMKTAQAGAAGDVDYPFALQWARRSFLFSGKNMVLWGMGLPMGILAWAGFLWAGWRMLKGEWQKHALLWVWVAFYFTWQSSYFNPTMRYQLPVYPPLAVFAGWVLVDLWDRFGSGRLKVDVLRLKDRLSTFNLKRAIIFVIGAIALIGTFAWAFAFTRIYTRPITRVAASRWIYQNIPGPINLHIQTSSGVYNQPLNFQGGYVIQPGSPYLTSFTAEEDGSLAEINLGRIESTSNPATPATVQLTVADQRGGKPLGTASVNINAAQASDPSNPGVLFTLNQPIQLSFQHRYYLVMEVKDGQGSYGIDGPITLRADTGQGLINQQLPFPSGMIRADQPFAASFTAQADGILNEIYLPHVLEQAASGGNDILQLEISSGVSGQPLATAVLEANMSTSASPNGQALLLKLDKPLPVKKGQYFNLKLALQNPGGAVTLRGAGIANESDFDDGLPLSVDGYNAGIYPQGLVFQMYWDDNPDKLVRFLNTMDQSDVIMITSNRQWGSIPRVPERYPLETLYYRELIGCPPDKDILWCYAVAQPGTFQGKLGFELVQVFQSDPSLGPIQINDQSAEEAFTVYDHPKVLIFKKTGAYNPQQVRQILGTVDFSHVIRLTPKKASGHPADLMLPSNSLAVQQEGGTLSDLFNPNALQNRFEVLGVLVWYFSIFLLGLLAYPLVRLALPGLADHGYPLARTAGLLCLAYLVWLAGSFNIPFTRLTIGLALLLIVVLAAVLAYRQRDELCQEWRAHRRYYLMIEGLFLAFFLFDLLIRYGNPDLWHPNFGGERPMDFSYFNAVLKSTTFPPYDPWFAGGYLNYYYYGFVLVGVPVKFLGILPSFAYNLILPTMFSLIALGAFSVAWNIFSHWQERDSRHQPAASEQEITEADPLAESGQRIMDPDPPAESGQPPAVSDQEIRERGQGIGDSGLESVAVDLKEEIRTPTAPGQPLPQVGRSRVFTIRPTPFLAGLAATLLMVVLGNLGTVRMIFRGYEMLAAPGGNIQQADLITRWVWAGEGLVKALQGTPLPYGRGDWYWIPSRVMTPGDYAITEFPLFTVLYGDPHAHLYAMPVALLALAFALSVVLGHARWKGILGMLSGFLLGALAIGALYPINLSDIYTYLPLGMVAVGYALWRYFDVSKARWLPSMPDISKRLLVTGGGVALLAILSLLLYRPYSWWYGQAYGSVTLWVGPLTPISSYLTHWGLFLFIFVTWMLWESIDWMAHTPLSALRKLEPYRGLILGCLVALIGAILALQYRAISIGWTGLSIAWLVLPLAAWAGVLLLRPGLLDGKRIVLFLIGTGLMITMMVEVIVVKGDIGRQNTVFKFYLQTWTLFAASGAAIVGWMLSALPDWRPRWQLAWQVPLVALVVGAALFTLLGSMAKIKDRMAPQAPHTLDGMAYMAYATYDESGTIMNLSQDYLAIRWMQENVKGSPVIVEANSRNLYRWFTRFTVYTGLPDVVGWEWHQQQQRGLVPGNWVSERIDDVDQFYQTTDPQAARTFLEKYNVRYVIFGQLERIRYPGPGLAKFPARDGILWKTVYHNQDTTIYEVIEQP